MFVVILLLNLILKSETKFYNETTNATDLSRCKVHYSRSESVYKEFYEITDKTHENGTILDFHITVLAPSDAHILLSSTIKVDKSDPAYEIVLGAGGNMFSDIRRQQKASVKASVRIKNLLNSLDPQSFWIHISKDGLIEVGREGVELAFINWKDPNPIPIKYFSFGTWPGVEAKWYFDCPREDNTTGDSKEVKRQLTHVERLRNDLLAYYDPYVRPVLNPVDKTTVEMKLDVNYLSLDEYKSVMSIKGQMILNWLDEKLKWKPNEYGNITILHIVGREVWQPDLMLFNAADIIGRDILDQTTMTVTHAGMLEWKPSTNMDVWCDTSEIGHWPNDIHKCDISLGFSSHINNLELQFTNHSQIIGKLYNTEWNVLGVSVATNSSGLEQPKYTNNYHIPQLKLLFKIQRSSKIYDAVFFTPFLVIAISMLATFCVSPFGCLKISFGCLQLIIASLMMVNLAGYIPSHPEKVPYLVNLYSFSFVASLISIFITILVINLSRSQFKTTMPFRAWTLLTSSPVQRILLLQKCNKSENYGKLDEGTTSIKRDDRGQNHWAVLGVIIDRISLVIYFGLIVYAISVKY